MCYTAWKILYVAGVLSFVNLDCWKPIEGRVVCCWRSVVSKWDQLYNLRYILNLHAVLKSCIIFLCIACDHWKCTKTLICALIPLVIDITELWSWVYWICCVRFGFTFQYICYSFGAEYILKVVILFAGFTICIAAFWKTLYWISSPCIAANWSCDTVIVSL